MALYIPQCKKKERFSSLDNCESYKKNTRLNLDRFRTESKITLTEMFRTHEFASVYSKNDFFFLPTSLFTLTIHGINHPPH